MEAKQCSLPRKQISLRVSDIKPGAPHLSCLHWVTSLESPGDLWVSWLQAVIRLCTFPS